MVKLQFSMAANLRRGADATSPAERVRQHRRLFEALISGDAARTDQELTRHGSRRYFH